MEIRGDIIKMAKEGHFGAIIQGCNCQHNMGAGLALQIAKEFPEAEIADKNFINPTMGDFSWAKSLEYNFVIYNLYSQFWYGKPYGHTYALNSNIYNFDTQKNRYNAIRKGLKRINNLCSGKIIGVPKIGCGLAGGNWDIVSQIVKEELTDCMITFVIR